MPTSEDVFRVADEMRSEAMRIASIHPAAPANINLIILNSSEWLSQHPVGEFQTHFSGIGSQGRQAPS